MIVRDENGKPIFNEETIKEITKYAFEDKLSFVQISKLLGYNSVKTIKKITLNTDLYKQISRNSIENAKYDNKRSNAARQKHQYILDNFDSLYKELNDISLIELCKKYNLSQKTFRRILKDKGLSSRFRTGIIKKQIKSNQFDQFSEKYKTTIEELIKLRLTIPEIAEKIDANYVFLKDFIKDRISKELQNTLKFNTKQKCDLIRQNNSSIIAIRNKGSEKKPISDEMKKQFQILKQQNVNIMEIRRRLNLSEFTTKKLCKLFGKPVRLDQSGSNNPMYGKRPSVKAGIGSKGWLTLGDIKIFFRSSLELKIFLYLYENNIKFKLSKHCIKYKDEHGKDRTYQPDIVIDNFIYEIKPSQLTNTKENILKFNALQKYAKNYSLECGYITENTYDLKKYNKTYIEDLINSKKIDMLDHKNYEKLMRYLND